MVSVQPTLSGPVGPVTRAEFTLRSDAGDFYDVTLIDGVNVPVEMKPTTQDVINASAAGTAADYWCGNPGGISSMSSSLSGCSWSYNPTNISGYGDQSTSLTLVAKSSDTNGNSNCSKDSDCPQGQDGCSGAYGVSGYRVTAWCAVVLCGEPLPLRHVSAIIQSGKKKLSRGFSG